MHIHAQSEAEQSEVEQSSVVPQQLHRIESSSSLLEHSRFFNSFLYLLLSFVQLFLSFIEAYGVFSCARAPAMHEFSHVLSSLIELSCVIKIS